MAITISSVLKHYCYSNSNRITLPVCDAKDRNHPCVMTVIGTLSCEKAWIARGYVEVFVPKPDEVEVKVKVKVRANHIEDIKTTHLEVVLIKSDDLALLCDFSNMTQEEGRLHREFFKTRKLSTDILREA